MVTRY